MCRHLAAIHSQMGIWTAHPFVLLKTRHLEFWRNDHIGHKTHIRGTQANNILPSQLPYLLGKFLTHPLGGHVLERSWVTHRWCILIELPDIVILQIFLALRSGGPQILLLVLLSPLLIIRHSLSGGMSGSNIPLIVHSVEEISIYPIKRRNMCLYSWEWSNTSKSPRVSGDNGRNSGSYVVSCSGGGGSGCGSSNGGSRSGGGPPPPPRLM